MAHPFHRHRAHMVARSRAHEIAHAEGGGVHSDVAADKRLIRDMVAKSALKRARGGRTGPIDININTGGSPGAMPPPPVPITPPPGAVPPGAMPPRPPGLGAPGLGPPPGVPMRARGGRTTQREGGPRVGRAWEESVRAGTPVQHSPDLTTSHDVGKRGKPITYAKGGAVKHHRSHRATGGPLEAPPGSHAPKLPGGSGGGLARLAKAHRAAHRGS